MGTVEARVRDLFGGPSDLVVLPCSTTGTITQFVRDRLKQYEIPFLPARRMMLGQVDIHPFEGGEDLAQYVAYAASVDNDSTTSDAIRHIGIRLGECTSNNAAVRFVSVPLLGSGAGRLPPKKSATNLATGFKQTSHDDARLIICALNKSIHDEISEVSRPHPETNRVSEMERPLRVFISYSQTSPEHSNWVSTLGTFLRQNGIDARLDKWHLRRGMDLQHFMQNELKMADRIILISDAQYADKADGRHGGVGWETMLIQADVKDLPPDNVKYLIIVRDKSFAKSVPLFLKTKFAIHWPDESKDNANQETLLRELFDAVEIPPIGPRPAFL